MQMDQQGFRFLYLIPFLLKVNRIKIPAEKLNRLPECPKLTNSYISSLATPSNSLFGLSI